MLIVDKPVGVASGRDRYQDMLALVCTLGLKGGFVSLASRRKKMISNMLGAGGSREPDAYFPTPRPRSCRGRHCPCSSLHEFGSDSVAHETGHG
jgi:hypothetical protein